MTIDGISADPSFLASSDKDSQTLFATADIWLETVLCPVLCQHAFKLLI